MRQHDYEFREEAERVLALHEISLKSASLSTGPRSILTRTNFGARFSIIWTFRYTTTGNNGAASA